MQCGELLYGKRFPPKLKGNAYKSSAWQAIPYRSGEWCLRENEMGFL